MIWIFIGGAIAFAFAWPHLAIGRFAADLARRYLGRRPD